MWSLLKHNLQIYVSFQKKTGKSKSINYISHASMKIGILSILILLTLQQSPPNPYLFTKQINDSIVASTSSHSLQRAAWNYSYIGEYQKALWAWDQDGGRYPSLSDEEKANFLSFHSISARKVILQQAKDEKVIMINEAHHQPMHRTFTISLLQGLYNQGYQFLGIETLNHDDTLLNERGYPLLSSGYYSQEPQYGNLIREALKIGYEIFPYETQVWGDGKEREIQQAKNIQRVIEAHPEAKFLIHCGFDHINESAAIQGWEKAMAGRVKEYTGVDPFTINQEIMTERYQSAKENPCFKLVDTLQETSVFINKEGDLFQGGLGDERYDARIFHPRTTYASGRPSWLFMDGKRSTYVTDSKVINITYPVMIKAYKAGESEDAVPLDIIEWQDDSDQKALALSPGEYELKILNLAGDGLKTRVKVE